MGNVKKLQMDIQYILNVLSAHGEQKAVEAFENVRKAIPTQQVPMYGDHIKTVGQLRHILRDLDDHDQLCIETIDTETGDSQDLFPMNIDVIDNIRLLDDTIVREVRFCQMPNAEPDTRDKIELVDAVIRQLMDDYYHGDQTVLNELLLRMPYEVLKHSLPEEMWADFEESEDVQECKKSGMHLQSCDDDGFCNECGNQ